jgi:ComF family protein
VALALRLKALGGAALDALLPPTCLTCEEPVAEQGGLCPACFARLAFVTAPMCAVCGVPLPHEAAGEVHAEGLVCAACLAAPPAFLRARAALRYDEGAKALILPFKHRDRTEMAQPLARQMARAGAELLRQAELLVPVPLHRWRLFRRRHNQAALLARALSRLSGVPHAPLLLQRARRTRPLGDLGAAARAAELAGAFRVPPRAAAKLAGRRVLLVDDVLTSGATANACAHALLEAGAASVEVLAAARVPDPRIERAR